MSEQPKQITVSVGSLSFAFSSEGEGYWGADLDDLSAGLELLKSGAYRASVGDTNGCDCNGEGIASQPEAAMRLALADLAHDLENHAREIRDFRCRVRRALR